MNTQIETKISKPKTTRKKQNKEMSIDVVMEQMTLEVPHDQSDTMDLINELPKAEIKPETKQRRTRKPKIQELQEHPAAIPKAPKEEVKEAFSTEKASNPWIQHIKAFAKEHNLTYNKAMLHGDLKKTYVKTVSAKNMVSAP